MFSQGGDHTCSSHFETSKVQCNPIQSQQDQHYSITNILPDQDKGFQLL